jgi:inosine triphosphate pyrophosphatase
MRNPDPYSRGGISIVITDSRQVQGPVLTEDSALEFRALYVCDRDAWLVCRPVDSEVCFSHRKEFYSALGNDGLCQLLASFEDKSASAVCTYAFSCGPGVEPVLFQGRVDGQVVTPRGTNGFGKVLIC